MKWNLFVKCFILYLVHVCNDNKLMSGVWLGSGTIDQHLVPQNLVLLVFKNDVLAALHYSRKVSKSPKLSIGYLRNPQAMESGWRSKNLNAVNWVFLNASFKWPRISFRLGQDLQHWFDGDFLKLNKLLLNLTDILFQAIFIRHKAGEMPYSKSIWRSESRYRCKKMCT